MGGSLHQCKRNNKEKFVVDFSTNKFIPFYFLHTWVTGVNWLEKKQKRLGWAGPLEILPLSKIWMEPRVGLK